MRKRTNELIKNNISDNVRYLCKEVKQMSNFEFANYVNLVNQRDIVTADMIRNYMYKLGIPSVESIDAISYTFGISVHDLLYKNFLEMNR